jgi:TonB family protein
LLRERNDVRKAGIIAVFLGLAVNAGVLLALPVLAGAIETALPSAAPLEVRDVELVELKPPEHVPIPREMVRRDRETAYTMRTPERKPDVPPESPKSAPSQTAPGVQRNIDIDIDIEPGLSIPGADIALGPAGVAPAAQESPTAGGETEKGIWSLDEVDRYPVKIAHIQPLYPRWALDQGVEGEVTVVLIIGADGNVESAAIEQSSGFEDFDLAALEAVRRWKFIPAKAGDRSVAVQAVQKIRFSLCQ